MIAQNIFDLSIVYHVDCLRFCFITLLENDLDNMKTMWNNHFIRCQTNSECPSGRPNIISVDIDDIVVAESFWKEDRLFGCSSILTSFASDIINENNLEMPRNIIETRHLYELLLSKINNF